MVFPGFELNNSIKAKVGKVFVFKGYLVGRARGGERERKTDRIRKTSKRKVIEFVYKRVYIFLT